MQNIVQDGDPVLRKNAIAIPIKNITSSKIRKIIRHMKSALESADDGVAIAAPQIGESLRIFVVSHRAEEIMHEDSPEHKGTDTVYINPIIKELSEEMTDLEEGCLSVKSIFGTTRRATRAVIEAYDEKGKRFRQEGFGLMAQIFQHETDHLNGTLFVDKAKDLYMYKPNNDSSRLAFWGSDVFSVYVLETLKTRGLVPHVIITNAPQKHGRGLLLKETPVSKWAEREKILCITPDKLDEAFIESYKKEQVACALVASYGKILSQTILDIPKEGTYNIHPSLLPRWRGASPIESALLHDDKTGVSLMRMDFKMDHGPLVTQANIDFPTWPYNKDTLLKTLAERGGEQFMDSYEAILQKKVELKPQDDSLATYCAKIEKEDGLINLSDDPQINLRKIFAYSGWPSAFFFMERNGKKTRVIIESAHIKDNALMLDMVKPEGKRVMSYDEFMRGSGKKQ